MESSYGGVNPGSPIAVVCAGIFVIVAGVAGVVLERRRGIRTSKYRIGPIVAVAFGLALMIFGLVRP